MADLYYCLGCSNIMEAEDFDEQLENALRLYKKQDNHLGKIKVYIQIGKGYRYAIHTYVYTVAM